MEARFADGRRARAESPEALLEREVGWSVPLTGLRYWIVGAPALDGATSKMELDDRGRLARLEQAGWTVIYERYGILDDLALPERIRFSSESSKRPSSSGDGRWSVIRCERAGGQGAGNVSMT